MPRSKGEGEEHLRRTGTGGGERKKDFGTGESNGLQSEHMRLTRTGEDRAFEGEDQMDRIRGMLAVKGIKVQGSQTGLSSQEGTIVNWDS